jgi:hypothetical protein
LHPCTQENMKHALVKSMYSLLKQLFGSVNIESVMLSPFPRNYKYGESNENHAKCCHQSAR